MSHKYISRTFDGEMFGYYSGSFSKESAEMMKRKIMKSGSKVRIVKGKERHPTDGRMINFYRIYMRLRA